MSNQPVVFNILYTPYELPKGATKEEIAKHSDERAFFDMTGGKNIFTYITTESKRMGRFTALEYLQKNTGVFNDKGIIEQDKVDEMKARLKENKGHIWHGFISLSEEESHKIDTPEKCVELIKRVFPKFFADAKFHKNNVDLMCALHLDRPHHLHIHFVFWEKEPKYKKRDGEVRYRRLGKIDKKSIDNMFVRLGLYLSKRKDKVYKSRDKSLSELKELLGAKAIMAGNEQIKKEIIALIKDLPQTGRVSYGSKDMEKFRPRIDKIVLMLLSANNKAMKANRRFYEAVDDREREIKNICGKQYSYSTDRIKPNDVEEKLPKYNNTIDEKNIDMIDGLKADYKRRQGNLVLNLCKFLKPQYFERKRKYKADDKHLKTKLNMSRKIISRECKRFFKSFAQQRELLERDFTHRLQDIEKEIENERKKKSKDSNYNYETK